MFSYFKTLFLQVSITCSWKMYSLSNSLSSERHSNHFSQLMLWHPSKTDLEVMAHTPCLRRLTLAHPWVPWIGLAVGKNGYKKRESCLYLALLSKLCFHENPRESKRNSRATYKILVTRWAVLNTEYSVKNLNYRVLCRFQNFYNISLYILYIEYIFY